MKNKITTGLFLLVIIGFGIANIIVPDREYSVSERRKLAQFSEVAQASVADGSFMEEFEQYSQDQFVAREAFRRLKVLSEFYVFGKSDYNGLYLADGHAAEMDYPLNEDSVLHAADRFSDIYEAYLEDSKCSCYLSVIPDKHYYLAQEHGYPVYDYDRLEELMVSGRANWKYLELRSVLGPEDYYRTDIHWKQENLQEVAEYLARGMGNPIKTVEYEAVPANDTFYGVYASQLPLKTEADRLYYLNNEDVQQYIVYDHQNDKTGSVYDQELAAGRDPYEMFLGGSLSLVTMENPNGTTGRELILFRDSFGSSVAPLLMAYYDKITLVDIRYIVPEQLGRFIEFEEQDVLFLYSAAVLNHSETIK